MKFPIYNGNDKQAEFINTIAPIVVNEYLYRKAIKDKVISPTVVIAQAILESGWNLNSKSLFGIKGEGTTAHTKEFVNGEWIDIEASFKSYPDLFSSVVGYYDLMQWENYDDATGAYPVEPEIEGLTNDIGYAYATDPDYGDKLLSIINDYNLRMFNDYVYQTDIQGDIIKLNTDICIVNSGDNIYTYHLTNIQNSKGDL